jgi:GntR family transcriptional regulator
MPFLLSVRTVPNSNADHTNRKWYGQLRDFGILDHERLVRARSVWSCRCQLLPVAASSEAFVVDGVRSEQEKSDQPKYRQLRDALIERIRGLPEGAALPTERELCADFGVSRATVRHALQRLEGEQRIYRRQGKGTFVAHAKIEQRLGLTSHTEEMRARGMVPGSKLIDVSRIPASAEVAVALQLGEGAEVLQIERLRLADGEPIAIEVLYLNAERFDGISAALGESGSFYQLLHSDYGVDLASADETIEAVIAGAREAELLGCGTDAPLLLLSRLSLDTRGRPTEYVRSLYRGDRFRLRRHLERDHEDAPAVPSLRAAGETDAAALASVFVSSWQAGYPGIVDDAVIAALDEAEVAGWLQPMASDTMQTVLAESAEGTVLGWLRYGNDPDDPQNGHIYSLYVRPSAGGRGVGRLLLEHGIERCGANGRAVTLWVFEANARARQLYRSAGFAPDGGRRVEAEYGAQEVHLTRPASSEQTLA